MCVFCLHCQRDLLIFRWQFFFHLSMPSYCLLVSIVCNQKLAVRVLLWCSALRIWHCHWSGLGQCCGVGLNSGLGTLTYHGHSPLTPPKKMKFWPFILLEFTYRWWVTFPLLLSRWSPYIWLSDTSLLSIWMWSACIYPTYRASWICRLNF